MIVSLHEPERAPNASSMPKFPGRNARQDVDPLQGYSLVYNTQKAVPDETRFGRIRSNLSIPLA